MAAISTFAHLYRAGMGSSVTIEARTGVTGNNVPLYDVPRVYQCDVYQQYQKIVTLSGDEIEAAARTSIYPVANDATPLLALSADARITMPDGAQPRILTVFTLNDQKGNIMLYIVYT